MPDWKPGSARLTFPRTSDHIVWQFSQREAATGSCDLRSRSMCSAGVSRTAMSELYRVAISEALSLWDPPSMKLFPEDSSAIGPRLRHLTQVLSQPVLLHQVFAANILCCDSVVNNAINQMMSLWHGVVGWYTYCECVKTFSNFLRACKTLLHRLPQSGSREGLWFLCLAVSRVKLLALIQI